MCTFEKCCFCIDLRSGCLLIAYMELFGQITVALCVIPALATSQGLMVEDDQAPAPVTGPGWTIILSITLTMAVIFIVFIIGLLIGLHQNKPRPVKMYLIFALVAIVVRSISMTTQIATSPTTLEDIGVQLFGLLLGIYYISVIRSYWLQMTIEIENKANRWQINPWRIA